MAAGVKGRGELVADLSERERFLVGLLEKSLGVYEDGRSGLAQLVRDVGSASNELANVSDAGWVAELRRAWAALEIIYALMLDEGRSSLSHEERRDVGEAVVALRALIAQ